MLRLLCFLTLLSICIEGKTWGFFAHKRINYIAIFTLPPEIFGFYKNYAHIIEQEATKADRRRYIVKNEAPKHYIDLEYFIQNDSLILDMNWYNMVECYTEDSLMAFGILPWNLQNVKRNLEEAFKVKDVDKILRYSADIGHYIADAHVPLHTTENYDGQLSGQEGIHAFWESRLPELFIKNYDLFTGKATYIKDFKVLVRQIIIESHTALDSVLSFEKLLTQKLKPDKKYTHTMKRGFLKKTYSSYFATKYHKMLDNQVERRMRQAIKRIGDTWFTCWVDAGQPQLDQKIKNNLTFFQDSLQIQKPILKLKRAHE